MEITPTTQPRILAVTSSGAAVSRAFARLVQALRDKGAEVIPLPIPSQQPEAPESTPTLSDFKRGITSLAKDIVSTLRGDEEPAPETHASWLSSQLRTVEGKVDAVVAVSPDAARSAFEAVDEVWPGALRIAVDPDFDLDLGWRHVLYDDLVVPSPALGSNEARIIDRHARVRGGGPVVGGDSVPAKGADGNPPLLVVSFARLDPGDVDPLLFQLSLARPDRFDLLFLPSGRHGIDELVRTRAANYGLRGKRPKTGSDPEPWIKAAAALVGHASPAETAIAVHAKVPQLLFAAASRLSPGDIFLVEHGVVLHADVPITVAVHTEGLLPGGSDRARVEAALAEFETTGTEGAADEVLAAIREGRPAAVAARSEAGADAWSRDEPDDGLEEIGGAPTTPTRAVDMPKALRRAYLREIILQQNTVTKQLIKARAGLATWQRRVQLARAAGNDALANKAVPRVDGLMRLIERLAGQEAEFAGLRSRFAARGPIAAADQAAASRLMNPETAAMLDRGEAPDSAFTRLELDDALRMLKRKMGG